MPNSRRLSHPPVSSLPTRSTRNSYREGVLQTMRASDYPLKKNTRMQRAGDFGGHILGLIRWPENLGTDGTFTIDAWGNLTNKGPVGGKTYYESLNAAPASSKNQLNGFCDAAGNLIYTAACPQTSFTPSYTYDAENRMVSNAGAMYVYDGDGR